MLAHARLVWYTNASFINRVGPLNRTDIAIERQGHRVVHCVYNVFGSVYLFAVERITTWL